MCRTDQTRRWMNAMALILLACYLMDVQHTLFDLLFHWHCLHVNLFLFLIKWQWFLTWIINSLYDIFKIFFNVLMLNYHYLDSCLSHSLHEFNSTDKDKTIEDDIHPRDYGYLNMCQPWDCLPLDIFSIIILIFISWCDYIKSKKTFIDLLFK